MEGIIDLHPKMRVSKSWRDFWLIIVFVGTGIFGLGLWTGKRITTPQELNRRQAEQVAVEVMMRCEEVFIRNKSTPFEKRLANKKCQEIFNVALDAGFRVREKKR